MIAAATPLRLPLAGGLSDLKPYAARFGGATVSVTIDARAYVTVRDARDGAFTVRSGERVERTTDAARIRHDLAREAIRLVGGEQRPVSIDMQVDLPGESGLGTSGALTVSLLHALRRARGEDADRWSLLHDAARIEIDALDGASGFHDPAICALGGLRHLRYDGERVRDADLRVPDAMLRSLEDATLLFATGWHARSKPSLDRLRHDLDRALPVLHDIRDLADGVAHALASGDLPAVADGVAEQQALKLRLPGRFADERVRALLARIAPTGARAQLPGGKIGAVVMVICPDGQHEAVRSALSDLRPVPFRFASEGTRAVGL
ncbi:MAG: hypothetical protein WD336_01320 [Trueperaceae bacterium]